MNICEYNFVKFSKFHFLLALQMQKSLEEQMGCSLSELFPEIPEEDIKSRVQDYEEVLSLIEQKNKVKKHTE